MGCSRKRGDGGHVRKVAALIICLSIQAAWVYAACKSEACKQATAWKNGYTAIVLDDNIGRADYNDLMIPKGNQWVKIDPCSSLPPDLVTALITPPVERPYSAWYPPALTSTSWMKS